ncbi:MAG: RagB/SusD family nutrient uptake outer membrane protein [Pedobacter sp.]|uniref:RagB/SusD family nutrient uptake outer membrane protein n=1 Tax=Pedobacter sp. TaxID=1411316 RepID=UPI003396F06C
MKKNKFNYIYLALLAAISLTIPTSCRKNFLDEDLITLRNTQDFQTTDGLDGLVIGMYQGLRFHFNYEWAYSTTNYGVDEMTVGGDRTEQMFNSYDQNLNSLNGDVATVWDNMYGNINSANIVITNVPQYYTGGNKNVRLGEGYFMRAFDYFKLVKQYGGVPLQLTPSTTVSYEFARASAQQVYQQVIDDFTQAYALLPETPEAHGRITKYAAAHFLAKAYLYRASELNSSFNASTLTADLNNAVKYADIVINSGKHTLAANFRDLWNFTAVDGPNESNAEIILAAEFSNNTATQGRYGNQVHLYYPSLYQTLPGMQRDLPGDREFQRMRTTDYAIDVYDRLNDSRFWKSFKTVYLCNKPTGAPVWDAAHAPTPAQSGKVKFTGGQQSILYIVNDALDARYTAANILFRAPTMFVRYYAGETQNLIGTHGGYNSNQWPSLSKFIDGSRNAVASAFGQRDGILARLGETYLIAAEAQGRLGNYALALPYLNKVRDRAAYANGEDRSAYTDGGISYLTNPVANTAQYVSFAPTNTYYESNNNIAVTTASTQSALHLNSVDDILNSTHDFYTQLGAGSQSDKFIAFILNERSRELMGELMRWEDLSRTKTLIKRATVFNNEARPVDKHYLRPIPQKFLDGIQSGGAPLTGDQKTAMQNPGW